MILKEKKSFRKMFIVTDLVSLNVFNGANPILNSAVD